MISMIGFFSLLITLFILSFTILLFLKQYTKAQYLCYQTGLRIQKELSQPLKKLLKLNFKARRLRIKRKLSSHKYKLALATLRPVAIAQSKALLEFVKIQQKRHKARQLSLLNKSRRILNKRWEQFNKSEAKAFMLDLQKIKTRDALAVKSYPLGSASPSYKLISPFSLKQQLTIKYQLDPFSVVSPFWKKNLLLSKKMKQKCTTSLEKINNRLQARLMK